MVSTAIAPMPAVSWETVPSMAPVRIEFRPSSVASTP